MWLRVSNHPANAVRTVLAVKFNNVGFLELTHEEAFDGADFCWERNRDWRIGE
jgi:hypothetical protein